MICKKCGREIPEDSRLCCYCGQAVQTAGKRSKSRGNGQGTVYQLPNGRYVAVRTLGYYVDAAGKHHRRTVSRRFARKKDAVAALPLLGLDRTPEGKAQKKARTTFRELYDLWLPTHRAGPSTINCYKAAVQYFAPLYHERVADIDIDDLQECIDDCPKGKSTRKNMRVVAGLMYRYGIPRGYLPEKLDLSQYLSISGQDGKGGVGLPDDYLEAIRAASGASLAASYVLCHCYLGFRPAELLELSVERYDPIQRTFTGGAKTEAGKDRIVTVSPKIQPIIDRILGERTSGPVFCAASGGPLSIKQYREMFYRLLEDLGLENPVYDVNGTQRHTYTPHSCRHTFATLLKRVTGSSKDKLELIGHTSEEMLRYYQDAPVADLRRITDEI